MSKQLSRRDFLQGAAAASMVAAAGFGAGVAQAKEITDATGITEWDEEADVVIVGGGGAGLAAAIEAAGAGAEVIVLEKTGITGGSTRLSGGIICCGGAHYEEEMKGYTGDSPDKQFEYYMACDRIFGNVLDEELVRCYCDHVLENLEWLEDKGIQYVNCYGAKPTPGVPVELSEPPRMIIPGDETTGIETASGTGRIHADALLAAVESAGVPIELECAVKTLVVDSEVGVIGVTAERSDGSTCAIKARRGVILSTGGIDHDAELAHAVSPWHYDTMMNQMCLTAAGNTGDGHRMGMAAGAALCAVGGTINTATNTQIGRDPGGSSGSAIPGIGVNIHGQRFANEWSHYAYYSYKSFQQDEHKTWIIFDKTVYDMGEVALGVDSGVYAGEDSDAVKQLIDSGALVMGETVEELAENMGINPDGLRSTLDKWNEDMYNGGVDTLFGKSDGLAPIDQPPFYAARDIYASLGSIGGLKITTDCEVLDWAGEKIPHLYAAGMTAGGWIGAWYAESGTAVMGSVQWGRTAGKAAAAAEAWA